MNEEFQEWIVKVGKNKKNLDKMMFDDLIKNVVRRLEAEGEEAVMKYLDDNYRKCADSYMVGPKLLASNSKLIRDKLWSMARKK